MRRFLFPGLIPVSRLLIKAGDLLHLVQNPPFKRKYKSNIHAGRKKRLKKAHNDQTISFFGKTFPF